MKNLMFFLLMAVSAAGLAQPPVKLYGFRQSVAPGMVPKGTRGNGATFQHSIYFQHGNSEKISPVAAWINGKRFALAREVVPTPVVKNNKNENGGETVIVPAWAGKTILLVPLHVLATPALTASAKKLVNQNELVLEYDWKGKTWYKASKKFKLLEPASAE
jgi:hypothetical protein